MKITCESFFRFISNVKQDDKGLTGIFLEVFDLSMFFSNPLGCGFTCAGYFFLKTRLRRFHRAFRLVEASSVGSMVVLSDVLVL